MSKISFNVVTDDGEPSSVTAFIGGKPLVATKDHPRFAAIVSALEADADADTVNGLFNMGVALTNKFTPLSERVKINGGAIFFDGTRVNSALSNAIVGFYLQGHEDFQPLVNFMEKIEQNPNPHSRDHLFRWLSKHDFSITPDGDFIAYKGVQRDMKSQTSGKAIVNNELVNGRVLNAPDTVIEMARDEVTFDPHRGCSVGLHAGNWRYARNFGPVVLRVKINPRDVVSVPTDSSDEKLRVCRYKVMNKTDAPDTTMLALKDIDTRTQRVDVAKAHPVEDEPVKRGRKAASKPAAKKAAAKSKAPAKRYYEQLTEAEFNDEPMGELRWLAKEWDVSVQAPVTKPKLTKALAGEAKRRLKTW